MDGETKLKFYILILALIHAILSGLSYFDVVKIDDTEEAILSHSTFELISFLICLIILCLSGFLMYE
jgi:hypothetical protein